MSIRSEQFEVWRGRQQRRVEQILRDVGGDLAWLLKRGTFDANQYTDEYGWCFVVGCNNSGTSLVHSILERSGAVSTLPYEGQRYTQMLTRAARRGHERVWTEFLDELRLTENDPDDSKIRLTFDWTRLLPKPIRPIIVEKTTANAVRMRWLQKVFPQSYFIGMVRNGYAVTEGIIRKGERDVRRGARHWNLVNEIMLEDAAHLRRFYLLKYEDLVEDGVRVTGELERFLSLQSGSLQGPLQEEYSFRTINGTRNQGIVSMNQAGIHRLSKSDLEIISTEANRMLAHFNYTTTG